MRGRISLLLLCRGRFVTCTMTGNGVVTPTGTSWRPTLELLFHRGPSRPRRIGWMRSRPQLHRSRWSSLQPRGSRTLSWSNRTGRSAMGSLAVDGPLEAPPPRLVLTRLSLPLLLQRPVGPQGPSEFPTSPPPLWPAAFGSGPHPCVSACGHTHPALGACTPEGLPTRLVVTFGPGSAVRLHPCAAWFPPPCGVPRGA